MPSGRIKGGKNNFYSLEDKEKIIKEALEEGVRSTARKHNISHGMVCKWIKLYKENGEKVIDNKYKRGNPLARYTRKKNLTEKEQLELEIMKLRIENERLKKGYLMEGDGTVVIFKK